MTTIAKWIKTQLDTVRLPVGTVIALVIALFFAANLARGWMDLNYLSVAWGAEHEENAEKNAKAITDHVKEFKLYTAMADVKRTKSALFEVQAYIKANGEDQMSRERLQELQDDLADAEKYHDCVRLEQPNCELLQH